MTPQEFAVDGSGKDGMWVWWEPGKIRVNDLTQALITAGLPALAPQNPAEAWALREVLSTFVESTGLRQRGSPVVINPLSEDVNGFEAVRQDRGQDKNRHDFIMSIVEDHGLIRVADYSTQFLPTMPTVRSHVEAAMGQQYREQLEWHPTTVATNCIARVIKALNGTKCRQAGSIFFLPPTASQQFGDMADVIDAAEGDLSITLTVFPLKPGERSYRLVMESLTKEAADTLKEIDEAMANLGEHGMRADGQKSRLETLDSLLQKISDYEDLLGVTLSGMSDAVKQTRDAVTVCRVMGVCS